MPTRLEASLKLLANATNIKLDATAQAFLDYALADRLKWNELHDRIKQEKRRAVLAFITDPHIPYYSAPALELAARIVADVKPDLITTGSDAFEFADKSKFDDLRPRPFRRWDEDLDNALTAHAAYLNVFKTACSTSQYVWIPANHDKRIKIDVSRNSTGSYTYRNFVSDLRDQGVLYLTPRLRQGAYLDLNERLTITHGSGGGQVATAAKRMLDQQGFQRSVVFGHFHKFASVPKRGAHYDVSAYAVGCLSELDPVYGEGASDWENGIAIVKYDVHKEAHSVAQIKFSVFGQYLIAEYNDKRYSVKLPARKRIANFYY